MVVIVTSIIKEKIIFFYNIKLLKIYSLLPTLVPEKHLSRKIAEASVLLLLKIATVAKYY